MNLYKHTQSTTIEIIRQHASLRFYGTSKFFEYNVWPLQVYFFSFINYMGDLVEERAAIILFDLFHYYSCPRTFKLRINF